MNYRRWVRQVQSGLDVLRRPDRVPRPPYHLSIGTTTACPLRCAMCVREALVEGEHRLSLAQHQHLIDAARPQRVYIGDVGESLLDGELAAKIGHAKERGATVGLVASYAASRITPQALVETGLDWLDLSLDAATPETYATIRGRPCFEQVLARVRQILRARQAQGRQRPAVRLQLVIQQANQHEIVDLIRLAARLGVDGVDYRLLHLGATHRSPAELVDRLDWPAVGCSLRQADHLARALGVSSNAASFTPAVLERQRRLYQGGRSTPEHVRRCPVPWYSTLVAADGGVYGCCVLRLHGDGLLGNVYQDDLLAIWNSAAYQDFRRRMRTGHSPFRACFLCYPPSIWDGLAARIAGFLNFC